MEHTEPCIFASILLGNLSDHIRDAVLEILYLAVYKDRTIQHFVRHRTYPNNRTNPITCQTAAKNNSFVLDVNQVYFYDV